MRRTAAATGVAGIALITVSALVGCGSSAPTPAKPAAPAAGASANGTDTAQPPPNAPETNPVGDIPDNTAFVAFRPPSGQYQVKVPEGWARTGNGSVFTFTDKLNTVRVETVPAANPPTVDSARANEVPPIQSGAQRFSLQKVQTVKRKGGDAVLVTYKADSPVDPVTGKVVPDAFERYEFFRNGTEAVLTLSGPVRADNVDPWRTVTDSFTWLG
jgi:hypothetical protein